VQEKRKRRTDAALAQRLSHIHQVVIVDPDEVVRLAVSYDRLRVTLVDHLVCLPVGRLEVAKVLQVMKQRPDYFVGVAVVKLVALGFAQTHRHSRVAGIAGGLFEWSGGNFSRNSWPADPSPAALAQHRLDRRDQPARGRRDCPQVFGAGIKGKWQSVRNDDEAVHFRVS
jgi:hypothetical protein